jgi:hypothetical protein
MPRVSRSRSKGGPAEGQSYKGSRKTFSQWEKYRQVEYGGRRKEQARYPSKAQAYNKGIHSAAAARLKESNDYFYRKSRQGKSRIHYHRNSHSSSSRSPSYKNKSHSRKRYQSSSKSRSSSPAKSRNKFHKTSSSLRNDDSYTKSKIEDQYEKFKLFKFGNQSDKKSELSAEKSESTWVASINANSDNSCT